MEKGEKGEERRERERKKRREDKEREGRGNMKGNRARSQERGAAGSRRGLSQSDEQS